MGAFYLPLLKGCLTGAGLIIAIGAQNAFVLKQGLMKNRVFLTALFCALVDILLIALGAMGLGAFITSHTALLAVAKWGGAGFLFWYGLRSFRSVFSNQTLECVGEMRPPSLKETIVTLAAISFLNPHVYLDTVVLLGTIGAQFEASQRPLFAYGAMLASLFWFFGLCYGARLLRPFFENPKSWKLLEFAIGCIMWFIAITLLV